jgi:hypothetical protein
MGRILLYSGAQLEVRLHMFEPGVEETFIHNHGQPFISTCLQGSYVHKLWIVEPTLEESNVHHSHQRFPGGARCLPIQRSGKLSKVLSQPFQAGQSLWISHLAFHTVAAAAGIESIEPVVTLVIRDARKTGSTFILSPSEEIDAPAEPIRVATEKERLHMVDRVNIVWERYLNAPDPPSTSQPSVVITNSTLPAEELRTQLQSALNRFHAEYRMLALQLEHVDEREARELHNDRAFMDQQFIDRMMKLLDPPEKYLRSPERYGINPEFLSAAAHLFDVSQECASDWITLLRLPYRNDCVSLEDLYRYFTWSTSVTALETTSQTDSPLHFLLRSLPMFQRLGASVFRSSVTVRTALLQHGASQFALHAPEGNMQRSLVTLDQPDPVEMQFVRSVRQLVVSFKPNGT